MHHYQAIKLLLVSEYREHFDSVAFMYNYMRVREADFV